MYQKNFPCIYPSSTVRETLLDFRKNFLGILTHAGESLSQATRWPWEVTALTAYDPGSSLLLLI